MKYDLLIKNGTVVDGSGLPGFRADIGVLHGRIARIGRIDGAATRTLDAEGHVVCPGFIDGHTHMDAQVAWDPLGTCSCYHGVTSVIMGNCGFTLAPCKAEDKHLVMRNLERAEDISPQAMEAGIDWRWETFAEYLDVVDALPKGINYACYLGHSALRTYVMGERAFSETAGEADLQAMKRELRDAVRAGAMGFTTSRTRNHQTPDSGPVASRVANWQEVRELVGVLGEMNAGVFEIAGEDTGRDPERIGDYLSRLEALAVDTRVPVTFGMFASRRAPEVWPRYFEAAERTAQAGGRMFVQVHSRSLSVVLSFETTTPLDRLPVWETLRRRPLAEQKAAFQDPATRARLVEAFEQAPRGERTVGAEARRADFDLLFIMDGPSPPYRSVAEVAAERRLHPLELMMDLAVERDMKAFFTQPLFNEDQDAVLAMMKHPRSVVTFSDSGAHVSQIMDASLQTHVLSYWVRQRQALRLEEAIRMLSFVPASHWGMHDRGLLREGCVADINVLDPATVQARMPYVAYDLPAGARRLIQRSDGYLATIVNGQPVLENGEPVGVLPGQLIRGPLARRA
ncbi:MAG: amidohydrolase family protein [Gammaproteobacteria bacterium]|nr:amidohydrolase family protein [Gammaproteobacteria bacterium]